MAKQSFNIIRIGKWRVLVDKKDVARVLAKTWRVYFRGSSPKIVTNIGSDKQITLARFILSPSNDDLAFLKSIDPVRGCWDFRRQNLTIGRRSDRIRLLPKNSKRRTSLYKGVSKEAQGMWRASISVDGQSRNLGVFPSEREAARAYNAAAVYFFRQRAFLNSL